MLKFPFRDLPENERVLARRTCTLADAEWFAAASGDWNPIHVDEVAARRLIAGAIVVHGMATVLWALDAYCAAGGPPPSTLAAKFPGPVRVGETIETIVADATEDVVRLVVRRGGDVVVTLTLRLGGSRVAGDAKPGNPPRCHAEEHRFADLVGANGRTDIHGDLDALARRFPAAVERLGVLPVASIMTLSRIVGMKCPGLHSIFASIDLRLDAGAANGALAWKVEKMIPSALLRMQVDGGGLTGHFDAFVRPPPVVQPSMQTVAARVPARAFAGQRALVIGGSRGLGELTAKVVAAGGGDVVVTYATGRDDAERVAGEIRRWGGNAAVARLDVEDPAPAVSAIAPLTHAYYFAAPRIDRRKASAFDPLVYRALDLIFVEAFAGTALALARASPGLSIFYPSTVFLDDPPRDFAEYVAAKAAAEAVCAHLNRHAGMRVVSRRLPRVATDQTAALIPLSVAEALPLVVDFVGQMHSRAVSGSSS